jgi:hypothetical protein
MCGSYFGHEFFPASVPVVKLWKIIVQDKILHWFAYGDYTSIALKECLHNLKWNEND